MTNHRQYASPERPLPEKGTVLADIVLNVPSEAFATVNEICTRVGHHQRSIPALINIAKARRYIEPLHTPRRYPQAYRLTLFGRLVKQQLEANTNG